MKNRLMQITKERFGKEIRDCSDQQLYLALLCLTRALEKDRVPKRSDRKLYYISAEFLLGKLLSNNLINLGIYEEVRRALSEEGRDLASVEQAEPEPSLGNGGLGRLAACFLDSIATLGLSGDGIGLNYHYGLFRQFFEDHKQQEAKDTWIEPESWLQKTKTSFTVKFKSFSLKSVLYEIDVLGYGGGLNKLHLFDVDTLDESLVHGGIDFDKTDVSHNLTLFLYPDDSDRQGKLLRVYQQYFMVSSAAQLILKEMADQGYDLRRLDRHVVIQINDTHPSMVIPELIRLLTDKGISMDEAIRIVSRTCAYTNHTILAESLEKWPLDYLEEAVPHLLPIIRELDARVKARYRDDKLVIIDKNDLVHMAHMDIHYGFSVNGVANLHTEILKHSELKHFYDIYPKKFNNKTNGITFRRWLLHCNPRLAGYITQQIGDGWKQDAMLLNKLADHADDPAVLNRLLEIKQENKRDLKQYLKSTDGVEIDENSIYDVQIKRLHEYKRQQMNALYAIYKYKQIKEGHIPPRPITMIFGGKAAPAYTIAKDIIHLILCLQQLIDDDPQVSPHLKVVMVENYNVTKASKLIPACEVSEQISLASKEASGTGNMKCMLNGAVTLGTMDGANVEIHDLVGEDNIYIFGRPSSYVMDLYAKTAYHPQEFYSDPMVEELVDFIIGKRMIMIGEPLNLCRLYKDMVSKDWFMALLDLKEYIRVKEQTFADYENRQAWARKMLINTARAGYFSSDRTIAQYNQDIWHLSQP